MRVNQTSTNTPTEEVMRAIMRLLKYALMSLHRIGWIGYSEISIFNDTIGEVRHF